jgi:hypothetical protein
LAQRVCFKRHGLVCSLGKKAGASEPLALGVAIDLIEHVGRHRHIDTNALYVRGRCGDEHGNAVPVLRVLHDLFQRAWFRRGFAIRRQPFQMQRQSLRAHIARFIQSLSGADDARKIRKRYAVVAIGLFVDQGDVLSHFLFILCYRQGGPLALFLFCCSLFQFQGSLLFDAPECAHRDISPGVRHGYPAGRV